jgi:hypothetical protein
MPNILHLLWWPDPNPNFMQLGSFHLWMETPQAAKTKNKNQHPRQLNAKDLGVWLQEALDQTILPPQFEPIECKGFGCLAAGSLGPDDTSATIRAIRIDSAHGKRPTSFLS